MRSVYVILYEFDPASTKCLIVHTNSWLYLRFENFPNLSRLGLGLGLGDSFDLPAPLVRTRVTPPACAGGEKAAGVTYVRAAFLCERANFFEHFHTWDNLWEICTHRTDHDLDNLDQIVSFIFRCGIVQELYHTDPTRRKNALDRVSHIDQRYLCSEKM